MAARSYKDYGMSTGEYEAFVLPAYPMKVRSSSGVARKSAHATSPSPFPSDLSRSGVTPIDGSHVVPDSPDSMAGITSSEAEVSRSSIVKRKPNVLRGVLFITSGAAVGILAAMVARQHWSQTSQPSAQRAPAALGVDAYESSAAPALPARVESARVIRAPLPPQNGVVVPQMLNAQMLNAQMPNAQMPSAQMPNTLVAQQPIAHQQPRYGTPQQPMQLVQTPQGMVLMPVAPTTRPIAVTTGMELKAPAKKPAPPRYTPRTRRAYAPPPAPREESTPAAAPAQDLVQKGRALADEAL